MPNDNKPADATEPGTYFRFFNEIGIINQLTSTKVAKALPFGLTLSQFSLLNHFRRGLGANTPLGLAKAFQVTKGAMTNTVSQLERKGFVSVVPNEDDGRSKIVDITPQGLHAADQCTKALEEHFSDFAAAFEEADISELLAKTGRDQNVVGQ